MGPRENHVSVALIGYGVGGALFHAPFIAADPRLDLAAVVTADPGRRGEVLSRYPGTQVLERTEDLFDRLDDVDLVVVSTPNATHASLAEAVLSAGKPVVVDKPVTPSPAATRRLATIAEERDTWVVPFQNRRWDGDFRTVVDLLHRDVLGVLHTFESRYERWQPQLSVDPRRAWKNDGQPGAGTGIVFDLGSHLIDQAVVLFGRPLSVYGEVAVRRLSSGVDDDAFVALHYSDGPTGAPLDECRGGGPGPPLSPARRVGRLCEVGHGRPGGQPFGGTVTGRAPVGRRAPVLLGPHRHRDRTSRGAHPGRRPTSSSTPGWPRCFSRGVRPRSTSRTPSSPRK